MTLTMRHAAAMLCVAVGQLGKSELFEEKQNLVEHNPPLLGYDRERSQPYYLTTEGIRVLSEMMLAMRSVT